MLPYTSLIGTACTLQFRLSKVFGKCCHQLTNHVAKFLNILNDYFRCECGKLLSISFSSAFEMKVTLIYSILLFSSKVPRILYCAS